MIPAFILLIKELNFLDVFCNMVRNNEIISWNKRFWKLFADVISVLSKSQQHAIS
jgi:hypothetical protein